MPAQRLLLLPFLVTLACSDSGKNDADSGGTGDTADTGDSSDGSDGTGIPLRMTIVDGVTGAGVADGELCTVIPESDPPCLTTDADGIIETTWAVSEYSNVLTRFSQADYTTTLFVGRYDEGVRDGWTTALETTDAIELGYAVFSPATVAAYLATGGITAEPGMGLTVFQLISGDGSSMEGISVVLEDDAGEAVGVVGYQAADSVSIDRELSATSTSGVVGIANVPPGEYTLRTSHESLTCLPGFAFSSDIPDATTVPVEADSQTVGSMVCVAG
ncbi:MAG: hypothetical protein VX265_01535 [Myxococcota bacterium]|nr:hypothetical protein [Myxococcota bacterium]